MKPLPDFSKEIQGMPVWLAIESGCLFVTRADTDELLAYDSTNLVATVKSGGAAPVFAAPTLDGKTLLVANYHGPDNANTSTGASAASFHIGKDCSLTLADNKPHSGKSVNPARQGGAHVHSFVPVRNGIAYACDLGMDIIFSYGVAPDGTLSELQQTPTTPGTGPRHLVEHPTEPYIYVVYEMGMIVTVYQEMGEGKLKLLQTASLVPADKDPAGSKAAEIVISPDGSTVYATNRGVLNTVTVFKVVSGGTLKQVQQIDVPAYPRGMTLALNGALLLVAGQSHSQIASYHVGSDGLLTFTGHMLTEGIPPHPAAFAVGAPVSAGAILFS